MIIFSPEIEQIYIASFRVLSVARKPFGSHYYYYIRREENGEKKVAEIGRDRYLIR